MMCLSVSVAVTRSPEYRNGRDRKYTRSPGPASIATWPTGLIDTASKVGTSSDRGCWALAQAQIGIPEWQRPEVYALARASFDSNMADRSYRHRFEGRHVF